MTAAQEHFRTLFRRTFLQRFKPSWPNRSDRFLSDSWIVRSLGSTFGMGSETWRADQSGWPVLISADITKLSRP